MNGNLSPGTDGRRAFRRHAVLLALVLAATAVVTGPVMAVNGGEPLPYGSNKFTVRLQIGSERTCSGALVKPSWVLTAKSCFAPAGAKTSTGRMSPAGSPPPLPTTATARFWVRTIGGWKASVVYLVPHPDRDLVLAEVDAWDTEFTPIPIATAPPEPGEKLRATGYGRTATEWAPHAAHIATVTAGRPTTTALPITSAGPGAAICKGDAGGPTFREIGGRAELVAVHDVSGQKGCLDAPDTATSTATDIRVDGLSGWIDATTDRTSIYARDDRWSRTPVPLCYSRSGRTRLRWNENRLQIWKKDQIDDLLALETGDTFHFHTDGNLVIWDGGKAVWSSGTAGHPGARLECGEDGGLTIFDSDGTRLWQSGTGPVMYAATGTRLPGWHVYGRSMCTSAGPRTSVFFLGTTFHSSDGWQSITPPRDAVGGFERDGALTIRENGTGKLLWTTGTGGHPSARLVCEPGHAAIYDGTTKLWDTADNPTGELVSGVRSDRCVDSAASTNGDPAVLFVCQIDKWVGWTFHLRDGTVQTTRTNLCLDVSNGNPADGTPVQVWTCYPNHPNQTWERRPDGALRNPKTGKCLDVPKGTTEINTPLQIWKCNGTAAQRWTLRKNTASAAPPDARRRPPDRPVTPRALRGR
ncbi:ricin-type beta-trefoil lectin domain protein [Actinomadura sp. 3N508]|uniref:ricin-type beta-trefoil lectin domain protein n=1 Tax=Actinomadura sp. 3N508 TaxID=3375153 RepID=UPI00378C3C4D